MKFINIVLLCSLLMIKKVESEIYELKKVPAKIKSLHKRRRILDFDNEDSFLEEAYGDSYNLNYYYTTLYLGPKKMPQTYILDTGSPTTTSPCNRCNSCGKHLNQPYELSDDSNIISCKSNNCNLVPSSVCKENKCSFQISYSEGSRLAGFFNMQEVYFEMINKTPNITTKSFTIPIGCTTTETHLFTTQLADGIMGLNNSGKSFVSLLYHNKVISKNLFTICFAQNDGYFSIGEIDKTYHKTKIEYVPLYSGETNYYIKINKMQVGNVDIPVDRYRGFIDSGTTISYFPNEIYNSIKNKFLALSKEHGAIFGKFKNVAGLGFCGFFDSIDDKEKALNELWPNITFYFEGHDYVLTANDYYYDYTDNSIGACLGFEGESTSKLTLGGTFMHGHDVIFDKGNQQIGFAVADCNRGKLGGDNNNIKLNEEISDNNKEENKDDNNIKDKDNLLNGINKKNNILFYLFLILIVIFIVIIVVIAFMALKKCIFRKKYHPQIDIKDIEVKTDNKN